MLLEFGVEYYGSQEGILLGFRQETFWNSEKNLSGKSGDCFLWIRLEFVLASWKHPAFYERQWLPQSCSVFGRVENVWSLACVGWQDNDADRCDVKRNIVRTLLEHEFNVMVWDSKRKIILLFQRQCFLIFRMEPFWDSEGNPFKNLKEIVLWFLM